MAHRKYTMDQIFTMLKEHDAGVTIAEICRKYGVGNSTFHKWKTKYGGMEANDMQKLHQLEDENAKLKRLVAEQALDILGLKAVLEKKW